VSSGEHEAPALAIDHEELRRLRHDLRSPLLVIGGFAQLLAGDREVSTEERRQYAERIHAAAEELRRLLDENLG
jgi:signal transduction histidine kinase